MPMLYTVICILEAVTGKESDLQHMLIKVAELSRKEPACVTYRVHQDLTNKVTFVLYEQWLSKEEHQQQFSKPYIIALGSKLGDMLAKPYQCHFVGEL